MAFWGFDKWRRAPENCRQLCIYLHQADTIRQWLYYPSAAYTLSAQGMADLHAMCAMCNVRFNTSFPHGPHPHLDDGTSRSLQPKRSPLGA